MPPDRRPAPNAPRTPARPTEPDTEPDTGPAAEPATERVIVPVTDVSRAAPSPDASARAVRAELVRAGVDASGPDGACTVRLRRGARATPEEPWHVIDHAVKANGFPSWPGHASGRARYDTALRVEACVPNRHAEKSVWIDAHVLDAAGHVIHRETLALRWTQAAGDGADRFAYDGPLYHGSVATPGSVDPRPDARAVEYRLYCEQGGEVTTDGRAHRCALRSDVATP